MTTMIEVSYALGGIQGAERSKIKTGSFLLRFYYCLLLYTNINQPTNNAINIYLDTPFQPLHLFYRSLSSELDISCSTLPVYSYLKVIHPSKRDALIMLPVIYLALVCLPMPMPCSSHLVSKSHMRWWMH